MNKAHFQSMFGATKGAVYRYAGELPEGKDPTTLITEKFIESCGTDLFSIVVIHTSNMFVVYSDFGGEVLSSDFTYITDLIPDPIVEIVIPEPVITPPEEV